ncbi:MAG: TIGR03435 family protein, partial [Solirubrobacteraceae bacterium]
MGLLAAVSTRVTGAGETARTERSQQRASGRPTRSPGRLSATGITAKFLIWMAYGVMEFQVSGGPGWIDSQRYDLDAKVEES